MDFSFSLYMRVILTHFQVLGWSSKWLVPQGQDCQNLLQFSQDAALLDLLGGSTGHPSADIFVVVEGELLQVGIKMKFIRMFAAMFKHGWWWFQIFF